MNISANTLWNPIIPFLLFSIRLNLYFQKEFWHIKIQRRFTRLVFSRCYFYSYPIVPSYEDRLLTLGLDSLEIHRLKTDLIFFHQLVTGNINLETNIPIISETHTTRNNPRGIIPIRAIKNSRINFFLVRTSRLYLKLPSYLVILPLSSFSIQLKAMNLDFMLWNVLLYYFIFQSV